MLFIMELVHVFDNGMGIAKDKLISLRKQLQESTESLEHIGLINTNRRLVLTYGGSSAIRLYSHYSLGTCISFSIPID